MEPRISVKNLKKVFGPKPERAIPLLDQGMSKDEILKETGLAVGVADASFNVYEGEIVVIMGLSGSGKSTLVRCVNRLIEPTAGSVNIDGTDVLGLSFQGLLEFRRKKFGMVFQNFALLPHRTVQHNVEFGLEIQHVDEETRAQRAVDALKLVGLEGWEKNYPEQLSGGMQQRVGLARALAVDPDILLMDEAFSALDPLIRRGMQDELINLQERVQKTILFITHDLDEALKLGDRIVLMKDGAIVQEGTGEEILTRPANDYVAKFVEDVDISKVLTASSVMLDPRVVAYHSDGPRVALHKMKEQGISSIFALNKDHRLVGVVAAEKAAEAAKQQNRNLGDIMDDGYETVHPDTPVHDILPLIADTRYPVAVVNDDKRLVGVIVRGSLLAGLSERGQAQDGNGGSA
ncbi:MAG: glycine betaine/L-proline ABC transporter ATP-binding protein [Desulfatibacillaceae bacterium]